MYSVKVEGGERLKAQLDRLGKEVSGQKLEKAMRSGALIIQNAAKANAPYRTGTLRRSIHIGPEGNVPAPIITVTYVAVFVGTNLIYARIREFGGTIHARNAPRLVWQDYEGNWHAAISVTQGATPYLRPAIDENTGAVQAEVGRALIILIRAAI